MQQVTLLTELSPTFDKACTAGFAILSGLAAMVVLTACPQGILSFDTKTAAQTLSQASGALLRNKATTEAGKVPPSVAWSLLCFVRLLTLLVHSTQCNLMLYMFSHSVSQMVQQGTCPVFISYRVHANAGYVDSRRFSAPARRTLYAADVYLHVQSTCCS